MIKLLFDRELGKANLRNAYNRLSEKLIFCEEFNIEVQPFRFLKRILKLIPVLGF